MHSNKNSFGKSCPADPKLTVSYRNLKRINQKQSKRSPCTCNIIISKSSGIFCRLKTAAFSIMALEKRAEDTSGVVEFP